MRPTGRSARNDLTWETIHAQNKLRDSENLAERKDNERSELAECRAHRTSRCRRFGLVSFRRPRLLQQILKIAGKVMGEQDPDHPVNPAFVAFTREWGAMHKRSRPRGRPWKFAGKC